jgi:hypothetical protein
VARVPPTRAELTSLAEIHLYYEVAMLRGADTENRNRRARCTNIEQLDRDDSDRIACMAFFESTLLHARVLNDFLTFDPATKGWDDVWAGDYVPGWVPPTTAPLDRVPSVLPNGRPVRDSINKQLAHFSVERLNQEKFWFPTLVNEVFADLRTFANDMNNVCHAELAGVRDLLSRTAWRAS